MLGVLVHIVIGMDAHLVRQRAEHLQLALRLLHAFEGALALRFGDGEAKRLVAGVLRFGWKGDVLQNKRDGKTNDVTIAEHIYYHIAVYRHQTPVRLNERTKRTRDTAKYQARIVYNKSHIAYVIRIEFRQPPLAAVCCLHRA